jgi:hypothetical protein
MPYTVLLDPDALVDAEDVKAKSERKAMINAIDKLRKTGPHLGPPHTKSLKGIADLFELRPRQGQSPTRPIYARFGDAYVVLAIATKDNFEGRVREAQQRANQYAR